MVKRKQAGKYCLTVDFSALKTVTEHDSCPLPILNDFASSLHGCKVFSLIDFKSAFHQILMHPNSVNKTCTITPFGSFAWDYFLSDLEIQHNVSKDLSIKLHRILT